jgi:hypothetical protein
MAFSMRTIRLNLWYSYLLACSATKDESYVRQNSPQKSEQPPGRQAPIRIRMGICLALSTPCCALLFGACFPKNASAAEVGLGERPRESLELTAPNATYFELLGAAGLYSVNYERRFTPHLSGRLGFAVAPVVMFGGGGLVTIVPVAVYGLAGGTHHHFEYGGGASGVFQRNRSDVIWVPSAGYRYQRPDGGFLFRASAMILSRGSDLSDVLPSFGLSLGGAF